MTLAALAAAIRARASSRRARRCRTRSTRIERLDGALNSFITRARGGGARGGRGARPDRAGRCTACRSAVKDVIDVAGTRTTAALEGARATTWPAARRDGRRAAAAGGRGRRRQAQHARVRLGRARRRAQAFGPARNPWDTERICGGSSGGSGAAVAGGLVPGALGTDTAGSVRIPAALCGVTGIRPTTGRVPNRGVDPRLVDATTPSGRSRARREDCALLLDAIGGPDPERSVDDDRPGRAVPRRDRARRRGLRVGVVAHLLRARSRSTRGSRRWSRTAIGELERLGARVERVDAPVPAPRRGRPAARDAPRGGRGASPAGCGRGSPTTARTFAPACSPGSCCPPPPRSPGQRARRELARGGAAALRALRPARGAGDADRRAPDRRGPGRGRRADAAVPARADPVQLAVELPRACRRRACRAASSTGCPSGSRSTGRRLGEATRPPRRARLPAGDRLARAAAAASRLTTRRAPSYTPRTAHRRKGGQPMSVLIKGGRIVTAADDYVGDVYVEDGASRCSARRSTSAPRRRSTPRGKIVMPGRDRPAHAHRDVLRRDDDLRRLHVRHDGGGVRRDDDADRLLHPGAGR